MGLFGGGNSSSSSNTSTDNSNQNNQSGSEQSYSGTNSGAQLSVTGGGTVDDNETNTSYGFSGSEVSSLLDSVTSAFSEQSEAAATSASGIGNTTIGGLPISTSTFVVVGLAIAAAFLIIHARK